MDNNQNRRFHGYKCQKCKFVGPSAEFEGNICPKCGSNKLQYACCAKNRQKKPCGKPPLPNGRCEFHGGKSPPPGPTHPSYKHGRLSQCLPTAVAKKFNIAREDPELLSIRDDVALFDARRSIIAERLNTGESGASWELLQKHWSEFERGNRMSAEGVQTDNPELRAEARELITNSINAVGKLISQGAGEEAQWKELQKTTHELAALKQSETTRLQKLHSMMTAEEALLLIHQVQQAVMSVVSNVEQQREIGRILHGLVQTGHAPPTRLGGGIVEAIPDLQDLQDAEIVAEANGGGGDVVEQKE